MTAADLCHFGNEHFTFGHGEDGVMSYSFFVHCRARLHASSLKRFLLCGVKNAPQLQVAFVDRVLVLPSIARLLCINAQRAAFVFKRRVHFLLHQVEIAV